MIDISVLSKLKEDPMVYINDDIDFTALKIFYDNCVRLGSETNANISIATVHPDLWFGDFFELFASKIKMIVKSPSFQTFRIEQSELVVRNWTCQTAELKSDEELIKFLQDLDEYRTYAFFSIVKYVHVKSFDITWMVKYSDCSTKEEIRDKKISKIL
jgi:hypothetical protein